MNGKLLELALRKQRLQYQSGTLRAHCASQLDGLRPVLGIVDGFDRATAWFRRYPYLAATAVVTALLVARPKAVGRWARRGFIAWQFWRRGAHWLAARPALAEWLTRPGRRT